MATHSSVPAWRIPQTEKPGGLQSMGSQPVRHDRVTNTLTFTFSHQGQKTFSPSGIGPTEALGSGSSRQVYLPRSFIDTSPPS